MKVDFDKRIDRTGTCAVKFDFLKEYFGQEDLLPLWVADMDFESPKEIKDAIKERVDHGIYGYPLHDETYYSSIINWNQKRNWWKVENEWILPSLGVVTSIAFIIQALTEVGDEIMVQTPVYYPFFKTIKALKRKVIYNPLKLSNGKYVMDYEDLQEKIGPNTKLILLCSPHNPVGRVWEREELQKLAEICVRSGVTIVSDEIHSDLVYRGYKHIPIAQLSGEISNSTITLMSPSKTFNLAGLFTSYMVIENAGIRKRVEKSLRSFSIHQNIFGITALTAAYSFCEYWLEELMEYLEGNKGYVKRFLECNIPEIQLVEPEGTYLLWLDFRKLGFSKMDLDELILKKARLGMSDGATFGEEGDGFKRMNIACPRSVVEESMERLLTAYRELIG